MRLSMLTLSIIYIECDLHKICKRNDQNMVQICGEPDSACYRVQTWKARCDNKDIWIGSHTLDSECQTQSGSTGYTSIENLIQTSIASADNYNDTQCVSRQLNICTTYVCVRETGGLTSHLWSRSTRRSNCSGLTSHLWSISTRRSNCLGCLLHKLIWISNLYYDATSPGCIWIHKDHCTQPAQTSSGETTAQTPFGVTCAQTTSGGTSAQTTSGVTSAPTSSGVTTAQTPSGVTTAQTTSDVTSAPTLSGVTTAQTSSGVTTAQTPSGVTTAQTPSGVTSAQTTSGVTSAQTPSGVTSAQTTSGGTPVQTTSAERSDTTTSSSNGRTTDVQIVENICPDCEQKSGICVWVPSDGPPVEEVNKLIKSLLLEKKTLSSYKHTKTSAQDDRPSAKAIGQTGVVLCVLGFVGVVVLDAGRLVNWLEMRRRRRLSLRP